MNEWVLILYVMGFGLGGSSPSIAMQAFYSQEKCLAAGEEAKKQFSMVKYVCVKK